MPDRMPSDRESAARLLVLLREMLAERRCKAREMPDLEHYFAGQRLMPQPESDWFAACDAHTPSTHHGGNDDRTD